MSDEQTSGAATSGRSSWWGASLRTDSIDVDALRDAVFENASECLLVVDDDARIVFADPAVEALFGYELPDVVGKGFITLLAESNREQFANAFGSAVRNGSVEAEWDDRELVARRGDGSEVPVSVSFDAFTDGEETYYPGIVRDVGDRIDNRQRLQTERAFVESMFDALPDIVYAFDTSGSFLRWNEQVNDVTGYTDEEIEGMTPVEFVVEDDRERIATEIATVVGDGESRTVETHLLTKAGREIPYEITGAPLVEGEEIVGQTGVARDITSRKRREARLHRLNELNTVIRSVHRALIDATTHEEIERAVCERLVEDGAYAAAVVGRDDGSDGSIQETASAGIDPGAVMGIDPDATLGTHEDGISALATKAIRSRSIETSTELPATREWPEPSHRALAVVPLATDERTFGVLVVASRHADAFSERERTILAELGQGIGDAIQSAVTRRLLYADTVTEIELETTDPGLAFVRLSDRAGCRFDLVRALSFGEDDVFYVSATGAPVDRILDVADADPEIVRTAHVGSDGERELLELVTDGGTLTGVVTAHGARTVAGMANRGRSTLRIELPPDANVRDLVDGITDAFPGTELLARREVERSLRTPVGYREELTSEMTDKQRAALRAAYSAGYFEWPTRINNAEEVAAMLDIAPQTLHQHLRIALRKLLAAVFDTNPRDGDAVDDDPSA